MAFCNAKYVLGWMWFFCLIITHLLPFDQILQYSNVKLILQCRVDRWLYTNVWLPLLVGKGLCYAPNELVFFGGSAYLVPVLDRLADVFAVVSSHIITWHIFFICYQGCVILNKHFTKNSPHKGSQAVNYCIQYCIMLFPLIFFLH